MPVGRPARPSGLARVVDARVPGVGAKPIAEDWVNGGFFVLEPGALDYLSDDCVLEREPLERMAGDGRLAAYRHTGYWRCLDTHKDAVALEREWDPARFGS